MQINNLTIRIPQASPDPSGARKAQNPAASGFEPTYIYPNAQHGEQENIAGEEIIAIIEHADMKFEIRNTRSEFSVHEKTNEIMIKIYRDDQLIKEIPPEKILDMVAKMMEMAGLLVDEKA